MNGWKATIGINGFTMVFGLANHWYQWFCNGFWSGNHWYQWFFNGFVVQQPLDSMVFQWFPMIANHWSNDGMVTIHRYGLDRMVEPAEMKDIWLPEWKLFQFTPVSQCFRSHMANQILAAQMIPRLGVTGLASPLQGNYLPILTCFAFFSTSNTTICLGLRGWEGSAAKLTEKPTRQGARTAMTWWSPGMSAGRGASRQTRSLSLVWFQGRFNLNSLSVKCLPVLISGAFMNESAAAWREQGGWVGYPDSWDSARLEL